MRAAVLHGTRRLTVEERPEPQPAQGQVAVQVASVGVCGSDTHYYEHGRIGRFLVEAPLVLGHEASGTITAVGPGVSPDRVGQRVSIEPGVPDLTCRQCLAGRYNLCPGMVFFATPPVDGALAERVVVHEAFAHPVPDRMSDDAAALLEPLSVGIWACRKGRVTAGSRVLVTGAGPIGLMALQTALAFGATDVVVSDVNPARLALAKALGATQALDARATPLIDLDERPEVLLECSGNARATLDGLAVLQPAGRAVLVGMGVDELALPVPLVQEQELEVTGTFRYAGTWPTAVALVSSGRVDLDRLVTGTYTLAESAAALTASHDDPQSIKAVVHPQT
ncbi:MAG: Alcohol dehydrogenase GroES domain protein [Marmoricola sp.]|nr:Alcohol dehydrogenase GroES domain protein [Marmoricola sp.]